MSAEQAMAIGTAGLTAMLCVLALERYGLKPDDGPAIVTGAAGGVGSIAVALLARKGWQVIASTGQPEEATTSRTSARARSSRAANLSVVPARPLGKESWAAGIDTVGSTTLANLCARTRYGGAIAACGLAGGMDLPASVAPFILRNVALLGVDSVQAPMPLRQAGLAAAGGRPRPGPTARVDDDEDRPGQGHPAAVEDARRRRCAAGWSSRSAEAAEAGRRGGQAVVNWLYLAVAIVAEVIATSALKASDGFSRLAPSLVVVAGYGIAFACLSLTLRTIPVGIAYAIWSGVGIVLIALVGYFAFNQALDAPALIGMALILAGVLVINLFSRSAVH